MAIDSPTPRSRRAILAGAIGGVAGLVAGRLGRPDAAAAAAGSPLIVGANNDGGTSQTILRSTATGASFTLRTDAIATGSTGIFGHTASTQPYQTRGVYGLAWGPNSDAIQGVQGGTAGTGAAVRALGGNNHGIVATTANNGKYAITATGANGTAIRASAIQEGVYAEGYRAVHGKTTASGVSAGVYGENTGGTDTYGVYGRATGTINARGVFGESSSPSGANFGVYGQSASTSFSSAGVRAVASGAGGNAVYATATATSGQSFGLWAETADAAGQGAYIANSAGGSALYVVGNTTIVGTLAKSGGSFQIDHPLDPANKFLFHSFVESPDMMNVYNGNAKLDASGEVTIGLPDWFEALNRDFRYQLTPIGRSAPELHVKSGIKQNKFVIAGGGPSQEVSWQVTGIRQDAYAKAHPVTVEVAKVGKEKGRFLHAKEHGQPASKGIAQLHGKR